MTPVLDSAVCYHRRRGCTCVHPLHYGAALLSLLLFCQSVMVYEFCCLLPVQQSIAIKACLPIKYLHSLYGFRFEKRHFGLSYKMYSFDSFVGWLSLFDWTRICHCVNWNDGFWVKVRVFPSTFIVVWDLYSVLIRPVWQKYLEICALILFRNKGWKGTMEPWKYFQMKADIDALHWYWCRWTDADTLMLLFCCLLL